MPDTAQNTGGVMNSVRRIASSLLGIVHNRVELFSIELQEEKLRTARQMLWLGLALAFALAGILVAIATLAIYLWQTAGYAGLAGLSLGTLAIAGVLVWVICRRIQDAPKPFASTLDEFRKDMECFRQRD
jgi:uncharacterized membrane protein YqjE